MWAKNHKTEEAYAILMRMKGGKQARGFTIVETLVVVAVTGVLFTAIAITLSGRQQRTEFQQAINEVQSQIEQVINEVATGYYPNPNNFRCTATLTGPSFSSAGSVEQGSNTGCTFIGKAIQFRVGPTSDPEKLNVYTIAGLQRDTEGNEITKYVDAKPAIVPASTENKRLQYGVTTSDTLRAGGTTVTNMTAQIGGSFVSGGAIAFVNSLASYSSGAIMSGTQDVRLMPIRGTSLGQTQSASIASINAYLKGTGGNPDTDADAVTGAYICFASGGTDQSARITIGSNGRQLSVSTDIRGNKTCS